MGSGATQDVYKQPESMNSQEELKHLLSLILILHLYTTDEITAMPVFLHR